MNKEKQYEYIFKYRTISITCMYLGLFTLPLGAYNIFLIIIPLALIISSFVLWAKYWKCPVCGQNFTFIHGSMDKITHCPYCGKKLRNNNYQYKL